VILAGDKPENDNAGMAGNEAYTNSSDWNNKLVEKSAGY